MLAQTVPHQQFPPEVAHLSPIDAIANGDWMTQTLGVRSSN
jgi:hypothetical protein